jgi:quinol monooxygenase YgiN
MEVKKETQKKKDSLSENLDLYRKLNKEARMQYGNWLYKYLQDNEVSGIFFLEGYGMISIFRDDADRTLILEEAKLQQKLRERENDMVIEQTLQENSAKNIKKKTKNYIG